MSFELLFAKYTTSMRRITRMRNFNYIYLIFANMLRTFAKKIYKNSEPIYQYVLIIFGYTYRTSQNKIFDNEHS